MNKNRLLRASTNKYKHILVFFIACSLFSVMPSTVHAATINHDTDGTVASISYLEISGKYYNANFHEWDQSFNDLWDPNGDLIFGDGILSTAPMFWGDQTGADLAATAVIAALGVTEYTRISTLGDYFDTFFIPYGYKYHDWDGNNRLAEFHDAHPQSLGGDIKFNSDGYLLLNQDPYDPLISFVETSAPPVPIPGAVWLLGTGLAGMIGLRFRKKKK